MKALLGLLAFVFFLIVLIVMLTGGLILRAIRRMRQAAERAVEEQERLHREETGWRRQQYSQRQQTNWSRQSAQATETATGETIIDNRHQHRSDRKIFDDTDGEYVDFVEER